MDWGLGRYERIAQGLMPAARAVVERASPRAGERVLDIGCGTGNAALLAAARGALATGVDPAERLLVLARAGAAERGLSASFMAGSAEALPLADASADVALSVFGIIFAPDALAAAGEITRVCARSARVVLCAWLPGGAIGEVMALRRGALEAARSAPAPAPFPWHEREALEQIFGPHGFTLSMQESDLAFQAPSVEGFLEGELREHPMWIEARRILAPEAMSELRERALAILRSANEASSAFRVRSRYVIVSAARG